MFLIGRSKKIIPFVGFRVGYAYVSKRIWKKYSYLSGGVLLALGALSYILGIAVSPLMGIIISSLSLIFLAVLLTFLAERDAEKEALRLGLEPKKVERKFSPIPLGLPAIVVAAIAFFTVLATSLYLYPMLPKVVPTHFTLNGTPNAYSSKTEGVAGLLFGVGVLSGVAIFLGYLSIKKPEAYYRPYMKWESMKRLVEWLLILIMFLNVGVCLISVDILYYMVNKRMVIPLEWLGISILISIVSTLAVAFYYTFKGYRRPEIPEG